MIRSENLRLDKLKRALDLIRSRVVRAKAPADLIEIVDPAEATFAPPPATAAWRPFPLQGDWGSKQGWAWFRARLTVPRTWSPGGIELHLRLLPKAFSDRSSKYCRPRTKNMGKHRICSKIRRDH